MGPMRCLPTLFDRSRHALAVAAGVVMVVSGLAASTPRALGVTKQQVTAAQQKVQDLKAEIAAEQRKLGQLSTALGAITEKYIEEYAQVQQTQQQINDTQSQIDKEQAHYNDLTDQLDQRARQMYMLGPGNDLSFLLGSTSLVQLSDRLEFVQTVSQWNEDLAQQVQNAKNTLVAKRKSLTNLKLQQEAVLADYEKKKEAIQANFERQKELKAEIQKQYKNATALAAHLKKTYQRQLAALTGPSNGIFKYCPVGEPRAIANDFGAPRETPYFHLHQGDDILAPTGTPIYAPFSGTARSAGDPLGGLDVYVYGPLGYAFNAHLSALSSGSNGPVSAGTVIGYVGSSGDAAGPHDHFEWHPSAIPSDWPKSPYGYSVIEGAVNPYPLLLQACG